MRYYYVAQVNKARVVKVATEKTHLELQDCYTAIGCEWVEMVNFRAGGKTYTMIVDEEGKLTGKALNPVASMLYANPYDCIAGKAVITKTRGWATFTEDQAKEFDTGLSRGAISIEIVEEAE